MNDEAKQPWTETVHCRSKRHCRKCRDKEGGRRWRLIIAEDFDIPRVDFECPFGGEWGRPEMATPPGPPKKEPPPTTTELLANFAKATARWVKAGKPVVPEEIFQARLDTCMSCNHAAIKDGVFKKCNLCGCSSKKLEWATEKCPDDPPRWVEDLDTVNSPVKKIDKLKGAL